MNLSNIRSATLAVLFASILLSSEAYAASPADFTVELPVGGTGFRLSGAKGKDVDKPAATQHYNLGAGKIALSGFDPVGYFTQGKALKGRKELSATHRDVTYQFASAENKKLFSEAPDKYLPTYGGWCATAMAKGEKVEIDPTNFKVTNGRLFLFFKAFYANAIKDWNKDEANLTTKADANWKKISGE